MYHMNMIENSLMLKIFPGISLLQGPLRICRLPGNSEFFCSIKYPKYPQLQVYIKLQKNDIFWCSFLQMSGILIQIQEIILKLASLKLQKSIFSTPGHTVGQDHFYFKILVWLSKIRRKKWILCIFGGLHPKKLQNRYLGPEVALKIRYQAPS